MPVCIPIATTNITSQYLGNSSKPEAVSLPVDAKQNKKQKDGRQQSQRRLDHRYIHSVTGIGNGPINTRFTRTLRVALGSKFRRNFNSIQRSLDYVVAVRITVVESRCIHVGSFRFSTVCKSLCWFSGYLALFSRAGYMALLQEALRELLHDGIPKSSSQLANTSGKAAEELLEWVSIECNSNSSEFFTSTLIELHFRVHKYRRFKSKLHARKCGGCTTPFGLP